MFIQTAILTVVTSRIGDCIEEVEEEELIEFMSGDYDKEEVEAAGSVQPAGAAFCALCVYTQLLLEAR